MNLLNKERMKIIMKYYFKIKTNNHFAHIILILFNLIKIIALTKIYQILKFKIIISFPANRPVNLSPL